MHIIAGGGPDEELGAPELNGHHSFGARTYT